MLSILQNILAWTPSLQFEEGIEKTILWYVNNKEWMDNITSGDYQEYYKKQYGK
jgi:dTDP-glucose 4,6-dehydratase